VDDDRRALTATVHPAILVVRELGGAGIPAELRTPADLLYLT
jgi:hypothetical protein